MANKRKLKSVSFNPTTQTQHIIEPDDCSSSQELEDQHTHEQEMQKGEYWYSADDLMCIKYSSNKKALAVRAEHAVNLRHRSSYSNTLLAAYLYCCGRSTAMMAANNNNVNNSNATKIDMNNSTMLMHHDHHSDDHHYDHVTTTSTTTMLGLAARLARATTNPTWRGLEFHSVLTVRMERARQRQSVRQAVLSVQRDYETNGNTADGSLTDSNSTTHSTLEERLRQVSEQGSATAVLFAQILGLADALAAQQYYQDRDSSVSVLRPAKRARSCKSTTLPVASSGATLTTDVGKTSTRAVCKTQIMPPFDKMPTEHVDLSLSSSLPHSVVAMPAIALKAL